MIALIVTNILVLYIFEKLNDDSARHHDCHQEDQDSQECSPITGMFLALIATNTYELYIFGNLKLKYECGSDVTHDDHNNDDYMLAGCLVMLGLMLLAI